jgi:DNA polymerase-3 subunit gamma/tau
VKAFEEFLGQPNRQKLSNLIGKIGDSDAAGVLAAIDEQLNSGQSASQIVVSLISVMRDILVVKSTGAKSELLVLTSQEREMTTALAEKFDAAGLIYNITTLERLRWTIKNSDTPRALLEAALLRLSLSEHFINIADLLDKSGGGPPADIKKKHTPAANVIAKDPVQKGSLRTAPVTHAIQGKIESIEAIKNNWQTIRTNMTENAGRNISGLLASAVPTELKDGVLTLQFPQSAEIIMQMCTSNGKAEVIESALGRSIGFNVKIRYELNRGGQTSSTARPPGAKTSKKQIDEVMNDPAVKMLFTELGARDIRVEEAQ